MRSFSLKAGPRGASYLTIDASADGLPVCPPRVSRRAHGLSFRRLHHARHVLHGRRVQTCAWRRRQWRSVSRSSSLIPIPRLGPFICRRWRKTSAVDATREDETTLFGCLPRYIPSNKAHESLPTPASRSKQNDFVLVRCTKLHPG